MKPAKNYRRFLGPVTLVLILILLVVKLFFTGCSLWLCGLFVAIIVAYSVLSDFWVGTKDQ